MRQTRVFAVLAFLALMLLPAQLHAAVKAEDVPLFDWRAHVVAVKDQKPAGKDFAFTFGRESPAAKTTGDAWSGWTPFDLNAAKAATKPGSYPNSYMRGYPLVVKLSVQGVEDPTAIEVQVRFSPTEAPVTIDANLFGPVLGILLWRDHDPARTPHAASMAQYNRRYWDVLGKVNITADQRPKLFPIVDRFIGGDDDYNDWREGLAGLTRAGMSAIMMPPDARLRRLLVEAGQVRTAWAVYSPPGYTNDYDPRITPEAISYWAHQEAAPYVKAGYVPQDLRTFAMSDEPGWYYPAAFKPLLANPAAMQRFHDYLKTHGMTPADLGAKIWDEVKPLGRSQATTLPAKRLFYWTMRFFSWDSSRHFAACTRALEEAFYPGMPIFTNWNFFSGRMYVPGPVANNPDKKNPDAAMGGQDWFEFGRMRGGTMLWTEDWFSDALAPQWSFYCAKLRSAAALGGIEFGGYVIPRTAGDREGGIIQKICTIVGSGGKAVEYFVFGPEYNFPGNCYSQNARVLPQMAEAHRMIAQAEDLLWPGRPPKAKVAILMPRSSQMWDLKDKELPTQIQDATHFNLAAQTMDYMAEVFGLYTALQHANYPCDFVDEDDLNPEGLKGIQVLYVTEPDIPIEGQEGLLHYLEKGGEVVLVNGAAQRDRYDEPCDFLRQRVHLTEDSREPSFIENLGALDPLVAKLSDPQRLPRQREDTHNNGPNSVKFDVLTRGGYFAVAFPFLPGIAYLRSADQTTNGMPSGWSSTFRDVICQPILDKIENARWVETDHALVETPILLSNRGAVVTLLNWSGQPIDKLRLTVQAPFPVARVASAKQGNLKFENTDKGVVVTLPVDAADFVMLYR